MFCISNSVRNCPKSLVKVKTEGRKCEYVALSVNDFAFSHADSRIYHRCRNGRLSVESDADPAGPMLLRSSDGWRKVTFGWCACWGRTTSKHWTAVAGFGQVVCLLLPNIKRSLTITTGKIWLSFTGSNQLFKQVSYKVSVYAHVQNSCVVAPQRHSPVTGLIKSLTICAAFPKFAFWSRNFPASVPPRSAIFPQIPAVNFPQGV